MARLIVFVNGLVADIESVRQLIRPGDVLLAADGGTRHALALGLLPSVVIGDLDSLSTDDRRRLDAGGVEIQRYPQDKDRNDLELVLDSAIQSREHEIIIIGALGGRLDQTLGNLSLLSHSRFSSYDIRLDDGLEEAFFTRNFGTIHGKPGDIVSLVPWGSEVTGISTEGLRWPLNRETLYPERTRGISNEMTQVTTSIQLKTGLLLVIHLRKGKPPL